MNLYGCIGKTLTHSFSKEIHEKLAGYRYQLMELGEDEIASFFEKRAFTAINVTIPYKETVLPYLDEVSAIAKRIGAVNTVVNKNGILYGDNTDYDGMKALIKRIGLSLFGKKVLILGTGGTAKTAAAVAEDLGASLILMVSRSKKPGALTYAEAESLHSDAEIIINTTPSGMYPDMESAPIRLDVFWRLKGVVDVIYNPLRTNLVLDAKKRGIPAEGGLYMLVMQAAAAAERFLGYPINPEKTEVVFLNLMAIKENIVLTGMPGSGKSSVGNLLAKKGFIFADIDTEIEKRCGCSIRNLIEQKGEAYFRDLETRVVREVSVKSGLVIAAGGDTILREENVRALKRNGKLYFLDADLSRLRVTSKRPLSDTCEKPEKLYAERKDCYQNTADVTVPELPAPQQEAEYILKKREELLFDVLK